MGLIDKAGKKALTKLPDLKLISLARESMPYISVQADGLSFFFSNTDPPDSHGISRPRRITHPSYPCQSVFKKTTVFNSQH
jgi:hypothetical protein